MKKQINTELIKHLINYNFLFLDKKSDNATKYSRIVKEQIQFKSKTKKEGIQILEIEQLIKNLKQLTRTLQFIKKQKRHALYLDVDNSYIKQILNIFVDKNKKILDRVKIENIYRKTRLKLELNSIIRLNKEVNPTKLFYKNYFVIHDINSKLEGNNFGTYKLFNNLNDWKKLIFFLMLIKKNYARNQ
jgi:hypothetical protein